MKRYVAMQKILIWNKASCMKKKIAILYYYYYLPYGTKGVAILPLVRHNWLILKSTSVSVSFRGISRLPSAFVFLR